jgi:RimJ/RimL family protein N-acetyltransferase
MKIEGYGIQLSTLEEKDIELVRRWRNSNKVRDAMLYQELISKEQQEQWFHGLDSRQLYLLIREGEQKIGLISIKNICWEERRGEAGIFIGEESYYGQSLAIFAILLLMDVCFQQFSFNSLSAKVKQGQLANLEMNRELGYRLLQEDSKAYYLEVSKEDYLKSREKWENLLQKIGKKPRVSELSLKEKIFMTAE